MMTDYECHYIPVKDYVDALLAKDKEARDAALHALEIAQGRMAHRGELYISWVISGISLAVAVIALVTR